MSETQLSRAIQDALEAMGALVVRVQSGIIRGPHGTVHCARPGTPDLHVAWRGATGWLEVKADSGKLSAEQVAWHDKARRCGDRVEVVRSVEQAARAVKGWTE